MKLLASVFGFFLSISYACELQKEKDYIVLSPPVSMLMEELQVIGGTRLISSYHPTALKHPRFSGSIFSRLDKLNATKNSVIFWDQSKDLARSMKAIPGQKVKIQTRGFSAIKATEYLVKQLSSHLRGCGQKLEQLQQKLRELEAKIKSAEFAHTYLLYISPIQHNLKKESLILSNDGFIKDLLKNESFKTYPSKSAYTQWSHKIVMQLKSAIHLGLENKTEAKLEKVGEDHFNISYPGVMTPGVGQVEFLEYFLSIKDSL